MLPSCALPEGSACSRENCSSISHALQQKYLCPWLASITATVLVGVQHVKQTLTNFRIFRTSPMAHSHMLRKILLPCEFVWCNGVLPLDMFWSRILDLRCPSCGGVQSGDRPQGHPIWVGSNVWLLHKQSKCGSIACRAAVC